MNTHIAPSEKNADQSVAESNAKERGSHVMAGYSSVHPPGSSPSASKPSTENRLPNKTGLPDKLKSGLEYLSGLAMDDVRVHYNSSQPGKISSHAYARGNQIYLGHGQERHLPHEAWHVVQQKQGRVRANTQFLKQAVNDEPALEAEASRMGNHALSTNLGQVPFLPKMVPAPSGPLQLNGPEEGKTYTYTIGRIKKKGELKKATINGFYEFTNGDVIRGKANIDGFELTGEEEPSDEEFSSSEEESFSSGEEEEDRGTPEEKIARAAERGRARKEKNRFNRGRYQTKTGPITIAGFNRQRISQGNKADYSKKSLGRIPPYSKMRDYMKKGDEQHIYDPDAKVRGRMSVERKLATSISIGASNVSEEDKAPGIAKVIRAEARAYHAGKIKTHPLHPKVNPAVESAKRARDFMAGKEKLNKEQRISIDEEFSSSSEEEDDHWATRTGVMTPIVPDLGSKGRKGKGLKKPEAKISKSIKKAAPKKKEPKKGGKKGGRRS